jgi:hypothetical protein
MDNFPNFDYYILNEGTSLNAFLYSNELDRKQSLHKNLIRYCDYDKQLSNYHYRRHYRNFRMQKPPVHD